MGTSVILRNLVIAWVTGATGFVGSTLSLRLCARGDRVLALVRPASRSRAPNGVEVVESVLPDISALAELPAPDVVFHCAAAIDGQEASCHAVHVEATLRLAAAAPAARFVLVSTTAVMASSSDVPLSESAPCSPKSAYGRTKLEGERRLLAIRPDAIVLRPPGIYGPHSTRDAVVHAARRMERGTFFLVGDGSAVRSWIFVETLVDAMLHAAERHELSGTFLVDDGRPVSRRELACEIAHVLGRPPRFARVPYRVAHAAAWALERALPHVGLRSPVTSEGVALAASSLPLDTRRFRATGFSPRFSQREAIAATLAGRVGANR